MYALNKLFGRPRSKVLLEQTSLFPVSLDVLSCNWTRILHSISFPANDGTGPGVVGVSLEEGKYTLKGDEITRGKRTMGAHTWTCVR